MATDPRALGEQPAVPYSQVEESETYSRTYAQHRGLTKRELFAGLAMQGLLPLLNPNQDEQTFAASTKEVAADAVAAADALLAALAEG